MNSQSVAFLGPEGTFAHLAAQTRFGKGADLVACPSIKGVFDYVASNEASVGIVPIENSSGGIISESVDCLVEDPYDGLLVQESLAVRVNLALMGKSREKIRVIYSHFAPLHHCQKWLDKNFPGIVREPVSSTAKAVRQAAEEEGAVAIGNRMAGELYGLDILEFPIRQDSDIENVTQFFVLGHSPSESPTSHCRTTLIATLPNSPGSLVDFLLPFKKEGINLSRVISRPIAGKPERYTFLFDIEGNPNEERVGKALQSARSVATTIRSLGTYPIREEYES